MTATTIKIDPTARIVVLVKDNPFREGTAVHARVGAVLRANGKPVSAALTRGARTSTVRHLVSEKLVRLERPVAAKKQAVA